MPIDGRKILDEILSTPEFEVEVYTPKHSCNFSFYIIIVKSESKCFDFIRNKKMHP